MASNGPSEIYVPAKFADTGKLWFNNKIVDREIKVVQAGSPLYIAKVWVVQTSLSYDGKKYKFDHWEHYSGTLPPGFTDGATSTTVVSNEYEPTWETCDYYAVFVTETYDITTEADPANAGTTTGDGSYAMGASCSIGVTPNPGYNFIKWTSDKSRVGKHKSHTFDVIGDEKWTAHLVVSDGSIICRQSNNLILDDNGILCI